MLHGTLRANTSGSAFLGGHVACSSLGKVAASQIARTWVEYFLSLAHCNKQRSSKFWLTANHKLNTSGESACCADDVESTPTSWRSGQNIASCAKGLEFNPAPVKAGTVVHDSPPLRRFCVVQAPSRRGWAPPLHTSKQYRECNEDLILNEILTLSTFHEQNLVQHLNSRNKEQCYKRSK